MTSTAVKALQEAAEALILMMLSESYLLAIHAKRSTLMQSDIRLATRLLQLENPAAPDKLAMQMLGKEVGRPGEARRAFVKSQPNSASTISHVMAA